VVAWRAGCRSAVDAASASAGDGASVAGPAAALEQLIQWGADSDGVWLTTAMRRSLNSQNTFPLKKYVLPAKTINVSVELYQFQLCRTIRVLEDGVDVVRDALPHGHVSWIVEFHAASFFVETPVHGTTESSRTMT